MEETGTEMSTRTGSSRALWFAWCIALIGAAQAVRHYLRANTFFIDEVKLLWNVADRDWSTLLEPLQNNQVAAAGFLILQKATVSILGVSELTSRLIPLLSMLLGIALFIPIARRVLTPISVVIATLLFAWSGPLIYYSSQCKQYTLDVLMGEAVLLATLALLDDLGQRRRWIIWGLVGVIATTLSIPVIVVLAGSVVTLFVTSVHAGNRRQTLAAGGIGLVWAICFGLLYLLKYRFEGGSDYMAGYWSIGFLPPPWQPVSFVSALIGLSDRLMREVAGIQLRSAGLAAYVIGLVVLLRRRTAIGLLMGSTMAVAVVFSALHLYPLKERAALYLLPFLVIPIAAVWDEATRSQGWFSKVAAGVLLSAVLVGHISGLGRVEVRADIKPVMEQLLQEAEEGDVVYIYWRPKRVIDFYDRWELGPDLLGNPRLSVIQGQAHIDEPLKYIDTVENLAESRGIGRAWFLYSRRYTEKGIDEVEVFRRALDQNGRLISEIESSDAGAWLYDLSADP